MLNLKDISLQLGQRVLFKNASLTIYAKQKVGVIGANGSGKSTLFSIILDQIKIDEGDFSKPTSLKIAHLSQETPALEISALEYVKQGDKELTQVEAELKLAEDNEDMEQIATLHSRYADLDGYTANARAAKLLDGLGFTANQYDKPVKSFSGGWRVRLNLAHALMARSDVLLLDEPTNHLDLDAIIWLENYLKIYQGTLLLISHDREFLDAIVDHIVHVSNSQFKTYLGNYSTFEKTRAEQLALQQASYEKQQKQIAHMMEYVNRFRYKASKARQAQSRLKAINRLEVLSAVQVESPFNFEFKEVAKPANPLLSLDKVEIGYGQKIILQNLNLYLAPGARMGLLGPNGAGKSTLIKLLADTILPQRGKFYKCPDLKVGYYAQHQLEQLFINESPLQHFKRIDSQATEQKLRSFLGGFDFRGDMAFTPITNFSGGEKARLALALLVWQAPNLLLLDEPTNHLDLEMRNALTLALQSYNGAMVIVSHDRYLLRATVDEFILVADQQAVPFDGTLDDYQVWLEKFRARTQKQAATEQLNIKSTLPKPSVSKVKIESAIKKLEVQLNNFESELEKVEKMLNDSEIYLPANQQQLADILERQKKLKEKISTVEAEWLDLYHQLNSV